MKVIANDRPESKTSPRRPHAVPASLDQKARFFKATPTAGGALVKDFCQSYGVSQNAFTRLAGFSRRAVAHWAQGRPPGNPAQKRLTELTRLFDALSDLVDPKAIGPWLKESNPAFEGSTPLQVIERGEADRIWRMIWELQSGNVD
jgi:DNA-binding transcriptional regulator YiaG